MKRKKTNPELKELIDSFSHTKEKFYRIISKYLSRPRRKMTPVNLAKINNCAVENDIIVIPSKVLAQGELNKKVKIYAFSYSKKCEEKIKSSGSEIHKIREVLDKNLKGKIII